MRTNVISFITDFGTRDNFVGVMKGVILTINPEAALVDITHEITPHCVSEASFLLERSYRFLPPGSVHVVIVDPGVGGSRRPIAVRADKHFFVCPDNGLLTHVLAGVSEFEARLLENKDFLLVKISNSFHGRDMFAPVAAYISKGVPFEKFGPRIADPVMLPLDRPFTKQDCLIGTVVYIDHYGNLVTNIREQELSGFLQGSAGLVQILKHQIPRVTSSYSATPVGEPLAIIGGFGMLEIAVNCGNAQQVLGASLNSEVVVSRSTDATA